MTVHASNLDIDRFRKVHALIAGGATDGERSAARARATAMAKKAGMTLLDAICQMQMPPVSKPASFFGGFEDHMEAKYPGYKADEERKRSDREARYAARRSEILDRFGSAKALLDPTPAELLLINAGRPFVQETYTYEDVCGTVRTHISRFAGASGNFFQIKDVDPAAVTAITAAISFPATVVSAFDELKVWDKLNQDRAHFYDHHEYYFDLPVELRVELLRDAVKNHPAATWGDLEARFRYKAYDWEQKWLDPQDFQDPEWSRLYADIQFLRSVSSPTEAAPSKGLNTINTPAQNGQRRTNADKAADVRSLLASNPELADREIARRAGVSPQTVSNWRMRLSQGDFFSTERRADA